MGQALLCTEASGCTVIQGCILKDANGSTILQTQGQTRDLHEDLLKRRMLRDALEVEEAFYDDMDQSYVAADFSMALPGGWTMTHEEVPECFRFFSEDACVIRPLARGHLEAVAPLSERRVLTCLPRHAVDLRLLDLYMPLDKRTQPLCQVHSVTEEDNCVVIEFEYPRGTSLQTLLHKSCSMTEACGRVCCRDLLETLSFLHRRSLSLRGCIPSTTVFVDESGAVQSVVPWACLLSAPGLWATAKGYLASRSADAPPGLAPEFLAAVVAGHTHFPIIGDFCTLADMHASASLVLLALSLARPEKVHAVAKNSSLSSSFFDLIVRALQKDPLFRLDLKSALRHPWLADVSTSDSGSEPSPQKLEADLPIMGTVL